MSSPFTTIEAFNNAADGPTEGAIYTFAQAPIFNYIALIVAVGLFVWFIIKAYGSHATSPDVKQSNNHLLLLLIAGLLSSFAADIKPSIRPSKIQRSYRTLSYPKIPASQRTANLFSLGLLGMVTPGGTSRRGSAIRKRRSPSKYPSTKRKRALQNR